MFDLANFSLRDMTELGSRLRKLGEGAGNMETVANRTVRYLFEEFAATDTGAPSCALVRFFKTHPYSDLDEALRGFARRALGDDSAAIPGMKCLALLATAGNRPEWNSRFTSEAHRAIPLAGFEIASRVPMISNLLSQLGVEVESLLSPSHELMVDSQPASFNVFYVPEAKGSSVIPDQEKFVEPFGIRSVVGFGGTLPSGDIFVVVMFSKVTIPRETVELFRTLALNVKMAALPFDQAVFGKSRESASGRNRTGAGIELRARISTLEQLLEVYESSVLEQADKLYAEQERIVLQKTLLECQGEASLDGSLSVSIDGRILFANRRLSEMWSIPSPVIGARSYTNVLDSMAERTTDPSAFLDRSIAAGEGLESREEVALRDGRTFDRYTAPILGPEGRLLGRVWQFRDITAFKEIDRLKDDFIAAVSHELRTPLTAIRGSLDLMTSGSTGTLPDEAMGLAVIARRNCQRLVRLINDVLDIEKIEAGRMDLRPETLALEAIVEQSVESMRPYAKELGVELQLENSAPGAQVRADPDRLAQVMENLLSNAAKFSPKGEVVCVRLARRGSALRVEVKDRGPGIPHEFLGRVFEKFSQMPGAGRRSKKGTGLGLNLARAIVEQHGGTIGFSARPEAGSLFYFDLPERLPGEDGAAP